MPKNTQLADATANGQADNLAARLNNGYLRIYSGTQPATANTALSGNTLLAELRFSATAAPAASAGVITFNALTSDAAADATGTATWFRCQQSDGTTVVMDGSIAADGNLVLNSTAISAGAAVSVSSFTHTVAKSAAGF